MLFYRAALPLSSKTLTFVSGVIRRHRAAIGSPWRKLNPGKQALLVLVYLRKGETFAELAAGFGVGVATAWRYVNETVALLAARAPKLRKAARDAKKKGHAYVVVDGTLIPVDRVAADRPFYSGKHKRHGMNLQVIASPGGDILWVSGALPGSVHDKKAEWICGERARAPPRRLRQGGPLNLNAFRRSSGNLQYGGCPPLAGLKVGGRLSGCNEKTKPPRPRLEVREPRGETHEPPI